MYTLDRKLPFSSFGGYVELFFLLNLFPEQGILFLQGCGFFFRNLLRLVGLDEAVYLERLLAFHHSFKIL